MIISQTPLRMSFTGGGSDLPVFYRNFGGAVVSTAIDKYVYVNVNKKFDNGIRVAYSKNEEVSCVGEIEHRLVRASLEYLGIDGGIEITTIADIPSGGTGLGSSSSFTVGLLNALNAYMGRYVSQERLGHDSCHIEIDLCGEPIGKQDQYAAAFGGFNLIQFHPNDSVVVSPIICGRETLEKVERQILVIYTGITRSASQLLRQQSDEVNGHVKKQALLKRMVKLTYVLADELRRDNADAIGEILHENWVLKKRLTEGITTSEIDDWYETARRAGATGGKLLGAGAGGFLMIYAPEEAHDAIKHALPMLRPIPMRFEPLGSRIIFYH
jgi:D-glycero-alpha-D-manno-heptose-7-phosphate kinase